MKKLNYHHLYYFWRIALTGSVTKTAEECFVSQSALSQQIMLFEQNMNVTLFERAGRKLTLTNMGEKVFAYADDIFTTGQELESFIKKGSENHQQHISVGVQTTLSRNFTERFINPLLLKPDNTFSISTRGINDLLEGLSKHEFDIILTNQHIGILNKGPEYNSQLISRQSISIIGPAGKAPSGDFPKGYSKIKWILPSQNIEIRSAFNAYCAVNNFKPTVVAQVDDMAMLRLLARDTGTLAVLPPVVVKDEIENGVLSEYLVLPNVYENFYAVTMKRKFIPDIIREMMNAIF